VRIRNLRQNRNRSSIPRGATWPERYGKAKQMKDVNREDRELKFRFLLLTLLSSPSASRHLTDIFILKKGACVSSSQTAIAGSISACQ
jgi:hypothetical protein